MNERSDQQFEPGTVARAVYKDGSGAEVALRTVYGWVGVRGDIPRHTESAYEFRPFEPLLLTTREALVKALREAVRGCADHVYSEAAEHVLASGAVVDAATLTDNEALTERLEQALVAYDEDGRVFGTSGAGAYFLAKHLAPQLADLLARERANALTSLADNIGMNAPHLADMLNAAAAGDEAIGVYIERHDAWIRGN